MWLFDNSWSKHADLSKKGTAKYRLLTVWNYWMILAGLFVTVSLLVEIMLLDSGLESRMSPSPSRSLTPVLLSPLVLSYAVPDRRHVRRRFRYHQ